MSRPLLGVLAASLLVAVTMATWGFFQWGKPLDLLVTFTEETSNDKKDLTIGEPLQATRLSYVSPAIRWEHETGFQQEGVVPAGQLLSFTEGEVELTYGNGTKLLLIGPAKFLMEEAGGKLYRGGLSLRFQNKGMGSRSKLPTERS